MEKTKLLGQLKQAYKRLQEALDISLDEPLALDGTIQRFEFTFEITWKTLRAYLDDQGIHCYSPKDCLKEAFKMGWFPPVTLTATRMEPHLNTMAHYKAERQYSMPVRSLNSSVLKWPEKKTVDKAVRKWAMIERQRHHGVRRLGYFGSYARDDWGVGSDLDLIAIMANSKEPFERRSLSWELSALPVHAELIVYTEKEWERIQKENGLFIRTLNHETVWVFIDKDSKP
jgi:nucleotidyltransferase substrate binding protein (TIGR01987 family)